MPYTVRRVALPAALRLGLTLGWLITFPPSCLLALLSVQLLRRVQATLAQVEPIALNVFGQEILRLDVLETIRLRESADTLLRLDLSGGAVIFSLTLLLMAVGTALLVIVLLLFCLGYNLLARLGAGLVVELEPAQGAAPPTTRSGER